VRAAASLLVLLWLALVAPAAWAQGIQSVPPTHEQRVEQLDQAITEIGKVLDAMRKEAAKSTHDVRGLTRLDDLEKWSFTPAMVKEVNELLGKARTSATDDAALDRAAELISGAVNGSDALRDYWDVVPQISWRARWTAFAKANGLDPAAIDAAVTSQEMSLLESLESGTFLVAARHSQNLDQLLDSAMSRLGAEISRTRKTADLVFVPRKSPCPVADATVGGPKARIAESGDPDALYPADAKERGEHGAIVVRVRIAASGCATAFARVVSSGYPQLDDAAIAVAEASRYLAAIEKGKPVASELSFKVRFDLK
jgi:TonB family protein